MLFGRLGALRSWDFRGTPCSSLITARVFLLPLVSALQGEAVSPRAREQAVLTHAIEENGPRLHFLRAKLTTVDGALGVSPFGSQDSLSCRCWQTPTA